jgi:hypothetical protein
MYGLINVYCGMDVDTVHIYSCTMIIADQQELKFLAVSKFMGRLFNNRTPILFVVDLYIIYIGGLTGIVLQIVV